MQLGAGPAWINPDTWELRLDLLDRVEQLRRSRGDTAGHPEMNPWVFNFGIQGCQPRWLTGLPAITTIQGQRLRALVGRRLTRTWLVWDVDDEVR